MALDNSEELSEPLGLEQTIIALWDDYEKEHDYLRHDYVCNYLQCEDKNSDEAKELTDKFGRESSKLLADYLDRMKAVIGVTAQDVHFMHNMFCKDLSFDISANEK